MSEPPPGPEVMCNTFESGVNELPKQRQKWSPKDNRKLWETYVESESERRGYMERMRKLWLQKTGKDEKAQRLRTQVKNIQKKIYSLMLREEKLSKEQS